MLFSARLLPRQKHVTARPKGMICFVHDISCRSQIEGMLRTAELDGCVSNLPIGVRIEIYCIVDMKLENDWICVNYPKLNKETSTLGDKPQDATNSSVAPMAKVEGVIHKGKSAKRKQNSQ